MSLRPGDIDGMRKALEGIRASPGSGRAAPFARVASAVFEEIESLRSERHTLADIRDALEAGGCLPEGSNPASLSKALCRERKRRGIRQARPREAPGAGKPAKGVYSSEKPRGGAGLETAGGVQQGGPERNVPGMRLQPGNKFVIEPLDLEGLPEL
jgi:hypothetical protein